MRAPSLPSDEASRLGALHGVDLLDTASELNFDEIVRIAARIAEVPIALISLVDGDRQWFKARYGLELRQTPRTVSFCAHAILQAEPLLVHDAREDERFRANPLVTAEPHIRFYAGFPLKHRGQPLGTLCVIDRVSRSLSERQVRLLSAVSRQVEVQFEARARSVASADDDSTRGSEATAAPAAADVISFRLRLHPTAAVEQLGGAFERLTGYRPEDFYGDAERGGQLVHPDDRPLLGLVLRAPTLFRRNLILRWRVQDGGWLWLEHRLAAVIEDGRPVAIEGTAWPARPATQPESAVGGLEPLTSHALDVIAIVEADGAYRYVSPAVSDVLGYAPAELVGRSAFDLVHPDDRAELLAEFTKRIRESGTTDRRRYRHRHTDGSWRLVESVGKNLIEDPNIRGILIQTRDMTAWAEAERSLEERRVETLRLAESRQQLVEDLRRLQQTKEQLSALIVHDLKSPLTAIIVNAQFILEDAQVGGMDPDPARDVLESAKSMQRMVMDLLDVSRSESGQLVAKLVDVDVAQLVDEISRGVAPVLASRKQTLSSDVRAEGGVQMDPDLIGRVLQNLLDNSSKYSPHGTEIGLKVACRDDVLRIEVLDQGPGVPDAYKGKIFELYAQVDRDAAKHARTSRGLGLAFCKLAVEAHGGRIWVEDRPEEGSRFCVEVPRRRR